LRVFLATRENSHSDAIVQFAEKELSKEKSIVDFSTINSDEQLIEFRRHLQQNEIDVIAMDFEGEFNLHSYGEKLCLVQIYDGEVFYIIDPFNLSKKELKKTLESRVIKLFYGAGSDRMLAYKQYGIKIRSLFDLELLVDLLGFEKKGLDAVLYELFNIEVHNKKKYQMYNWVTRPITKDAIQYALSDVEHLFRLKDTLLDMIKHRDMVERLAYSFARLSINYDSERIPGVKKMQGYRSLKAEEKRVFDKVFEIRERIAKRLDHSPHYVLSNEQLFSISRHRVAVSDLIFGKKISTSVQNELSGLLTKILTER